MSGDGSWAAVLLEWHDGAAHGSCGTCILQGSQGHHDGLPDHYRSAGVGETGSLSIRQCVCVALLLQHGPCTLQGSRVHQDAFADYHTWQLGVVKLSALQQLCSAAAATVSIACLIVAAAALPAAPVY